MLRNEPTLVSVKVKYRIFLFSEFGERGRHHHITKEVIENGGESRGPRVFKMYCNSI